MESMRIQTNAIRTLIENPSKLIETDDQLILIELSHSKYDFQGISRLNNNDDYGLIVNCLNPPDFIEPQSHFGRLNSNLNDYRSRTFKGAYKNRNNYLSGNRRLSLIEYAVFKNDPTFEIDETSITSVQYPTNVYAPMFSPGGVFRYKAFWSLYLPKSVKSYNERYLLRSLWSQRLMRLLDGRVKLHRLDHSEDFHQLNLYHSKNKASEINDQLLDKVKKLSNILNKWKCMNTGFYECVIDLSIKMAIEEFWSEDEVNEIRAWLAELNKIGMFTTPL